MSDDCSTSSLWRWAPGLSLRAGDPATEDVEPDVSTCLSPARGADARLQRRLVVEHALARRRAPGPGPGTSSTTYEPDPRVAAAA